MQVAPTQYSFVNATTVQRFHINAAPLHFILLPSKSHKFEPHLCNNTHRTQPACGCVDVKSAIVHTRISLLVEHIVHLKFQISLAEFVLCLHVTKPSTNEFTAFLRELHANVPELKDVVLGVSCSDNLSMADSCAIAAVRYGAGEIKAAAYRLNVVSLPNVAKVLAAKGEFYNAATTVRTTVMKRITGQIAWMCQTGRSKTSPFDNGVQEDDGSIYLTSHDDLSAVMKVASRLGYDLSEEDGAKVYEAFRLIAGKKDKVSAKELDAIVASAAMQVPPTYALDSYVVTSGNTISATAHMKLKKLGKTVEGVSLGDGPIDAAFLAIEQITGCHYELDDFQIQSVTEGREAMGQTVVKLRSAGKVYSGRGISTDIVGASILAYINALNKIVYEEESV